MFVEHGPTTNVISIHQSTTSEGSHEPISLPATSLFESVEELVVSLPSALGMNHEVCSIKKLHDWSVSTSSWYIIAPVSMKFTLFRMGRR